MVVTTSRSLRFSLNEIVTRKTENRVRLITYLVCFDLKGQEVKDDSGSESSRKDSEPDVNVDSSERNSDADNLFSSETLTVDIHERSSSERPVREPSPVSPAIFEMSKKMEASRKLWDSGLDIGRPGHQVAAWEETLRTSASVSSSIVGMPVVESNDLRLRDRRASCRERV